MHDGQNPRPLQLKATSRVSPHARHFSRAKPLQSSPQSRYGGVLSARVGDADRERPVVDRAEARSLPLGDHLVERRGLGPMPPETPGPEYGAQPRPCLLAWGLQEVRGRGPEGSLGLRRLGSTHRWGISAVRLAGPHGWASGLERGGVAPEIAVTRARAVSPFPPGRAPFCAGPSARNDSGSLPHTAWRLRTSRRIVAQPAE